jgi:hypothetical protein
MGTAEPAQEAFLRGGLDHVFISDPWEVPPTNLGHGPERGRDLLYLSKVSRLMGSRLRVI